METVLLSFFLHEDTLYLYFEDGKEIKLPVRQPDYDPFVMSWWSRSLISLVLTST